MRVRLNRATVTKIVAGCATLLFAVGLFKGFRSGGLDFRVFDHAARMALHGEAETLYREGPDRFLYAPGFAYLLAPLAVLHFKWTHTIWLLGCSASFFFAMRLLAKRIDREGGFGLLAVSVATVFLMRPIWIDLRYGQVNLLILAASVWAFTTATVDDRDPLARPVSRFTSWFFFSLAAFAKLYPLALFLVLVLRPRRSMFPALCGSVVGVALLALLPAIFSDVPPTVLYGEWWRALVARGFPLETHNQSMLAFLQRTFSGEIIRSHQTGGDPMLLGPRLLSDPAIRTVFGMFSLVVAFFFVRTARRAANRESSLALGLALALCFLPAHLVWKPYFLMGIPLAASVFAWASAVTADTSRRKALVIFFILFGVAHASSAEVIGRPASAWYEAFSGFLWLHLGLIACGIYASTRRRTNHSTERALP
jgi:alpha-1,2-mannosyltransferase